MRQKCLAFAAVVALGLGSAAAQTPHFPDATETTDQLIEFYRQADNQCRHVNAEDVRVTVGCVSRAIYGLALNERNMCLGKQGQDNASMEWHECEADSLRFPPFEIPEI